MSKHNSLVKQIEAFEKLAKFGSRVDFLQSLSQANVSDKIGPAVSSLYSAIQNWIKTSAERQSDIPGRPEAGLPVGLRQPVQNLINLMKNNTYDLDNLPMLNQTIKSLLNVSNLGNLGANAQNEWMKSVFPQASYVQDLVFKQLTDLKNHRSENAPFMDDENTNKVVQLSEQVVPGDIKPKKLNQATKVVSNALVNKINKLSDGPDRVAQLKEVEMGVKTLQNYFKRLQNSNATTDYLARADIINALNKVYSVLDYKDLETVVSLAPGRQGIPSDPNAKI